MRGQSTLAQFGQDHLSESTKMIAVYDCHNCHNQRGFRGSKVQCMGRQKDVPKGGCPSYTDGNDLAALLAFAPPKDYVPKKWAGE